MSALAIVDDFRRLHVALATDAPVPPIMARVGEQYVVHVCPISAKPHLRFLPAQTSLSPATDASPDGAVTPDDGAGVLSSAQLHDPLSFAQENPKPKEGTMSYPTEAKNFNLGRRLGAALSRRVLADYGLAEVVFADAMGISVGTVKNLKAGKTKVSGELLIRILRFFERADPAFRREVFDGTDVRVFIAAPDDHQLIDDLRTFEDARSRLKRRFG